MTNRLELNWKLDGFVDEQRYYCSETPIDPLNLPVPKAVLAGDVRTHADTAVEVGKTYYVAVGSVKNGVEKLSQASVVNVFEYLVKLVIDSDAVIDKGLLGKTWTVVGAPTLTAPDSIVFSRDTYFRSNNIDFNNDFEISAYVKIPTSANTALMNIFCNVDSNAQWSGGVFSFGAGGTTAGAGSANKFYVDGAISSLALRSTTIISRDVEYKVAFRRKNGLFELLVNDAVEASTTAFALRDAGVSVIGAYIPDSNQRFIGTMRAFNIRNL